MQLVAVDARVMSEWRDIYYHSMTILCIRLYTFFYICCSMQVICDLTSVTVDVMISHYTRN